MRQRAMTKRLRAGSFLLAGALAWAGAAGCKKSGGDIAGLRDALASGDTAKLARAVERAPSCAQAGQRAATDCLAQVATWLGSRKGFQTDPPDQAAAATAAVFLARDHRGEAVPTPEAWLFTLREGEGAGADALRLATASRVSAEAPALARILSSDADARALMRAVAASVPGACATYAALGAGADDAKAPPEEQADHAPCVQKDLERPTAPPERGKYGYGLWRGAEGALALWRDVAGALRDGAASKGVDADVAKALASSLPTIDGALGKIETPKLPPRADWSAFMGETHEDAGVPMAPVGSSRPR
jgi:hypothetical protein